MTTRYDADGGVYKARTTKGLYRASSGGGPFISAMGVQDPAEVFTLTGPFHGNPAASRNNITMEAIYTYRVTPSHVVVFRGGVPRDEVRAAATGGTEHFRDDHPAYPWGKRPFLLTWVLTEGAKGGMLNPAKALQAALDSGIPRPSWFQSWMDAGYLAEHGAGMLATRVFEADALAQDALRRIAVHALLEAGVPAWAIGPVATAGIPTAPASPGGPEAAERPSGEAASPSAPEGTSEADKALKELEDLGIL